MKRFSEQLKKRSDSIRMSAAERNDLRDRLVSYIEYHPLPKTKAQKNAEAYIQSEQYATFHFNSLYVKGFFSALTVLALIVVPVAAERALPGDVLYPIKVNINEEIRSSLANTPYEKVQWETERLERRISEARLLASEGRLTEKIEAEVTEAVRAHSNAAQQGIAMIRETDSDGAAIAEIAFESALTVQSEVLEGELEKEIKASGGASTSPGHSVAGLAGAVAEARKEASEKQSGVTPSYQKLMARMEFETTRAYELFEAIKGVASEEEVTDIERRLSDIERKINEASQMHLAQSEEETDEGIATTMTATDTPPSLPEVALLRKALSDLQKLTSFMTDIDVRENVPIDELIPVSLTDEEREVAVEELLQESEQLISDLETVLAAREDDERTEKLETGLAEATEYASSSRKALEEGELDAAETGVEQSFAILTDIKTLIGPITLPEPEAETGTSTGISTNGTGTSTPGPDVENGTSTGTSSDEATTTEEETTDEEN